MRPASGSQSARRAEHGDASRRLEGYLNQTMPENVPMPLSWNPEPLLNLSTPRRRSVENLKGARAGYSSQQSSCLSLPSATRTPGSKRLGASTAKMASASILDRIKEAAPKTPAYLIGNTKFPKAYIEGGFVITPRGFEKTPDGMEPPFYAQSGPSVLQNGVLIKNKGSAIVWQVSAQTLDVRAWRSVHA